MRKRRKKGTNEMSTTKAELLKTLRRKCMDCTYDQAKEIELCPARNCPLWPYRFGKDPYKTPRQLTEAQKEALAAGRARPLDVFK